MVNLDGLRQIDLEIEAAMESDTWTKDRFDALWSRGLVAAGGDRQLLQFISSFADPTWLSPAATVRTRKSRRVRSDVRDLILRLRLGWAPTVAFRRSTRFSWAGHHIASAIAAIADDVLVISCNGVDGSLLESKMDLPYGSVIRNRAAAEFRGGWTVELRDLAPRRSQHSYGAQPTSRFEFFFGQWFAQAPGSGPLRLWCAVIEGLSLPLGNLSLARSAVRVWAGRNRMTKSTGSGHHRLQGAYTYYLVKVSDDKVGLVVDTGEQSFETKLLGQDITAMQFVFGTRFAVPKIYGMSGDRITAVHTLHAPTPGNPYAVGAIFSGLDSDAPGRTASYFQGLSGALRRASSPRLYATIEAFLQDASLDTRVLVLQNAVLSLARAQLQRDPAYGGPSDAADLTPAQVIRTSIERLKLPLLEADLDEIETYRLRLLRWGSLVEEIERSDAELEREQRVLALLRSLTIALVAAEIGYSGPTPAPDPNAPQWQAMDQKLNGDGSDSDPWLAVAVPDYTTVPHVGSGSAVIFVGPPHHASIVKAIVRSSHIPEDAITVVVTGTLDALRDAVAQAPDEAVAACVVAGSKRRHTPDAVGAVRASLSVPVGLAVLPAIADVESWLLADDTFVHQEVSKFPGLDVVLEQIQPPDELPDALSIATLVFGPSDDWGKLIGYDAYRAAARSGSLRHFVAEVAQLVGAAVDLPVEGVSRSVSRDVIASVVKEMIAADAVAWRTSDGTTYTAGTIGREIETGTEVGKQYARDVLRVTIDLLAREGRRGR